MIGQCHTDPVTGIAGDIYDAWTGASDAGLTAGATVQGDPVRDLLAAQIEGIATGVDAAVTTGGAHQDGATVSWTQGTGAGQISMGTALPNGSLTSAVGCDDGGTIVFAAGTGTGTGTVITIHFAQAYAHAPSVMFYPADSPTAHIFFTAEQWGTSTTSTATWNTNSSPFGNATYRVHWKVQGATP